VAGSPLPGGRETPRPASGPCRQVSRPQEVPVAPDYMGRRAEDTLLQGAHPEPAPRMVPPGPVSESHQEEGTGPGHWTDTHASGQLVQKPQTT